MDFTEDPDHRAIREAVREVCARFPDEYWAERDESRACPREFSSMAKAAGRHAILAEFGGGGRLTEAAFVLEDAAACRPTAASAMHREYHVERYWREARLMRIAPVPQEMVLNYLAEHVLGLPRSY